MSGEQETQVDPAVEREAASMGWVPLEKFRGGQERWVDAQTFVNRGHEILPILQSNNRRLQEENANTKAVAEALKGEVSELRTTITELTNFQRAEVKRQVDAEVARIRVDLKAAKVAGNAELEVDLEESLDLAKERQREIASAPPPPPPKKTDPPAPQVDPDIKAWTEENDWFGKGASHDKRKTALVLAIAEEIHAKTGMKGRALLEAAADEASETLGGKPTGKTEGARGGDGSGGGGGRGNGQSFSDLPADAKAQAVADEKKFVGLNKAFKTTAEWRTHYASVYFNG